jgi:hypothetical protein
MVYKNVLYGILVYVLYANIPSGKYSASLLIEHREVPIWMQVIMQRGSYKAHVIDFIFPLNMDSSPSSYKKHDTLSDMT